MSTRPSVSFSATRFRTTRRTFPGSIRVAGTPRTDGGGDDVAEYDSANNRIVARLGTGANASAGGRLAAGASVQVCFRVTVNSPLPDDRLLENTATANFFAETAGVPLSATSSVNILVGAPDLTIAKTRLTIAPIPGLPVSYELAVSNVGDAASAGTVTVSDTLPTGLTVNSVSGSGWTCSPPGGSSFTCTRSDVLADGAAYPVISLTANTPPGDFGTKTNTATVSGGGDINFANNSSSNTYPTGNPVADIRVVKTASPTTHQRG